MTHTKWHDHQFFTFNSNTAALVRSDRWLSPNRIKDDSWVYVLDFPQFAGLAGFLVFVKDYASFCTCLGHKQLHVGCDTLMSSFCCFFFLYHLALLHLKPGFYGTGSYSCQVSICSDFLFVNAASLWFKYPLLQFFRLFFWEKMNTKLNWDWVTRKTESLWKCRWHHFSHSLRDLTPRSMFVQSCGREVCFFFCCCVILQ